MSNFPPEKKNRLNDSSNLDETWILEEHLTELFAELFQSQSILEQKIRELESEVQVLRQKINHLLGG